MSTLLHATVYVFLHNLLGLQKKKYWRRLLAVSMETVIYALPWKCDPLSRNGTLLQFRDSGPWLSCHYIYIYIYKIPLTHMR
jgi:hypothetical protein